MVWNPYQSREPVRTSRGEKFFFRFEGVEFELEWHRGDSSDDCTAWIRPYSETYATSAPEWFPNPWPRFGELIEPSTARWLLEVCHKNYMTGYSSGKRDKAREIKKALGI